jgi:1,4-dihydroxy-2-naphthoyl-CoA hydrolase
MNEPFIYHRTVHFQDTDAAGVVYFANSLSLCHEAYEASLTAAEIDIKAFFRGEAIAVPITHASIDFFKPMFCGDRLAIRLMPSLLTPASFQVEYQIFFDKDFDKESVEKNAIAKAITKHTCINPNTRKRCNLSHELSKWLTI